MGGLSGSKRKNERVEKENERVEKENERSKRKTSGSALFEAGFSVSGRARKEKEPLKRKDSF